MTAATVLTGGTRFSERMDIAAYNKGTTLAG